MKKKLFSYHWHGRPDPKNNELYIEMTSTMEAVILEVYAGCLLLFLGPAYKRHKMPMMLESFSVMHTQCHQNPLLIFLQCSSCKTSKALTFKSSYIFT